MTPGLKQAIPLESPTIATFIWFSGARGSLTRVTSDSHANPFVSSASQLTGIRNRCEVASLSLTRTIVVVSIAWVPLGVDPHDVTSKCCEFDSAVDLQPAVPLRLLVHAAFRTLLGAQPRAWRRQTSEIDIIPVSHSSLSESGFTPSSRVTDARLLLLVMSALPALTPSSRLIVLGPPNMRT